MQHLAICLLVGLVLGLLWNSGHKDIVSYNWTISWAAATEMSLAELNNLSFFAVNPLLHLQLPLQIMHQTIFL